MTDTIDNLEDLELAICNKHVEEAKKQFGDDIQINVGWSVGYDVDGTEIEVMSKVYSNPWTYFETIASPGITYNEIEIKQFED
jgi:hypothetical protein